MKAKLSKSRFVAGVQCLKRLYWQVYEPELADETADSLEAILEQGQEVGRLACMAFPGGITVEHGRDNLAEALRQTRELIAKPDVPAIFEATFEHGNVLVRVDILQRCPQNKWRLIEVKSTTGFKEHHIHDVGIQKFVLAGCGLELSEVCLMHLNREYVYEGGDYDYARLFRIRNLSEDVARSDASLVGEIQSQFRILDHAEPPEVAAGPQCSDPVECEFFSRCNPELPPDHIRRLPRIGARTIEKLTAMGIQSIHDIPENFPLAERARVACSSVQKGIPWYGAAVSRKLEEVQYPLYFMDFETVFPAVPRYAGMRPYDQLPFQWSVHIRRTPESDLEPHEFLADTDADPRSDFIISLCSVLGETGSIVVYNQTFESQRLGELANWIPERAAQIRRIQKRLWDLLPVVRDHIYYPEFAGSFSLKAVLPAVVPELTYKNMQVANGSDAGVAWESLIRGNLDLETRQRLKDSLLAYCGQDTLGLAQLLLRLQGFQRS